jgi:hypothetical protein
MPDDAAFSISTCMMNKRTPAPMCACVPHVYHIPTDLTQGDVSLCSCQILFQVEFFLFGNFELAAQTNNIRVPLPLDSLKRLYLEIGSFQQPLLLQNGVFEFLSPEWPFQ